MIFDNIANKEAYRNNPPLYAILEELGKIKIGVALREYNNKIRTMAEARFENHRHHIDVHFCIKGTEIMLIFRNLEELETIGEYDAECDMEFFSLKDGYSTMALHPGDFLVVFPGEAHAPNIAENNAALYKICKKITC